MQHSFCHRVLLVCMSLLALVAAAHPHLRQEEARQLAAATPTGLPVFFFHGVTANAMSGFNYQMNLTAEGRVFNALTFCTDLCSVRGLNSQVLMAMTQIRGIIAKDPVVYERGYIFIGHSQGAAIARAVIEEMDDHKVRTFISLAGAQNGIFYGPQTTDATPLLAFVNRIGPKMIPSAVFAFSNFKTPQDYAGPFQRAFSDMVLSQLQLQSQLAVVNLPRSPLHDDWAATNTFLPIINNINPCVGAGKTQCKNDQKRRKRNFLKLKAAHFFASPADDVVAPWQSAILGQYNDLVHSEEIVDRFSELHVLKMRETLEYQQDTYGLQSLDRRGGLFLHAIDNVGHSCWLVDSTPLGKTDKCLFKPIYDQHIYPLLQPCKHYGVLTICDQY